MYRSWAYILMVAATLAGVVALLWPSPPVRTIQEITVPSRPAPRAETPPKAPKTAARAGAGQGVKPAAKPAAPAPPAVLQRVPPQTTVSKRAGAAPLLQNGLNKNNPIAEALEEAARSAPGAAPAAKPGAPVAARPVLPARPGAANEKPARPGAAN